MRTLIRSDALLLVCPQISRQPQLEIKVAEWLMTKQVDYKSMAEGLRGDDDGKRKTQLITN